METLTYKAEVRWGNKNYKRGEMIEGLPVMRYNTFYLLDLATGELVAVETLSAVRASKAVADFILKQYEEIRRLPHTLKW